MGRITLAVAAGLLGFVLYIGAVVALADHVLPLNWAVQGLYFLVTGLAWTLPARWLLLWAGGAR
jgi:uncharacterized membrane protein